MFEMIASSSMGSDCTCCYKVILDKHYSVEEFVNTILTEKSNEWGHIRIEGKSYSYNHGKLESIIDQTVLKKKVVTVSASGGWSCMDYRIITELGIR